MRRTRRTLAGFGAAAMVFALTCLMIVALPALPDLGHPAMAQQEGHVPGGTLGNTSDAEFWRAIRQGEQGDRKSVV